MKITATLILTKEDIDNIELALVLADNHLHGCKFNGDDISRDIMINDLTNLYDKIKSFSWDGNFEVELSKKEYCTMLKLIKMAIDYLNNVKLDYGDETIERFKLESEKLYLSLT